MTSTEWFEKRQAEWVKEAQELVSQLRSKIEKHERKLRLTEDPDQKQWHKRRIAEHRQRIKVVRNQAGRLTRFLTRYNIQMTEIDFG